jgi:hypothetical protein
MSPEKRSNMMVGSLTVGAMGVQRSGGEAHT